METPKNIADIVKFYGVIETPSDTVSFWCSSYFVNGTHLSISNFLLDTSKTRHATFLQKGVIYYEKVDIIGYMAVFTPFEKQTKGGET
jgi:hypothetical protein